MPGDVKYSDYRLIQNGTVVVGVCAPGPDAWREINHYAAVYSQDGPVQIEIKTERGWKPVGEARAKEQSGG